jgi:hypothetical protein
MKLHHEKSTKSTSNQTNVEFLYANINSKIISRKRKEGSLIMATGCVLALISGGLMLAAVGVNQIKPIHEMLNKVLGEEE